MFDCNLSFAKDVDECFLKNPCKEEAICTNTPGSYECACAEGWQGDYCDQGMILIH